MAVNSRLAPQQAAPQQVATWQVAPEVHQHQQRQRVLQTAQTSGSEGDFNDFILPDIGEGIVEC